MKNQFQTGTSAELINLPALGLFENSSIFYTQVMRENGFVNGVIVELTHNIHQRSAFICKFKEHSYTIPVANLKPLASKFKIGDLAINENNYIILITNVSSTTKGISGIVVMSLSEKPIPLGSSVISVDRDRLELCKGKLRIEL